MQSQDLVECAETLWLHLLPATYTVWFLVCGVYTVSVCRSVHPLPEVRGMDSIPATCKSQCGLVLGQPVYWPECGRDHNVYGHDNDYGSMSHITAPGCSRVQGAQVTYSIELERPPYMHYGMLGVTLGSGEGHNQSLATCS